MSNKTIGPTGLSYLWSKLKAYFASKADLEGVAFIGNDDGTSGIINSSQTLASLADTTITNPSNGQGLLYDSSVNKWVNRTLSGGQGGGSGEANVIETVKVNGTALTPDANKAVNISAVTSFNGSTGAVTYSAPVTSVNGNTGAVVLNIPAAVTESTVSGWGFTKNSGTITGVTGSNGLTGSGTSGSVTISHAAPSTSPAKTTLAVYPIKIDQYGHITAAGTAVTIPSAPGTLNTNNTTAQTVSSSEALSGTIKLHKVAKTGTYSDLIGTPTNVSTFTNDANYVTSNNTVAIYSGSSAPSSSLGKNGDIYILTT